jgi:hypothetical protein
MEKPILFNTEMVRAILDGRKTQTRRPCKKQPNGSADFCRYDQFGTAIFTDGACLYPHYRIGDELYVRETYGDRAWYAAIGKLREDRYYYAADGKKAGWKYKPSIHMPKEAARIFLRVTDVRVQRVQDITEQEAIAEGIENILVNLDIQVPMWLNYMYDPKKDNDPWQACAQDAVDSFLSLWDSVYKNRQLNPWVFAYTFERIEKLSSK